MLYGIYQSAAGMQVNELRQAVTANNLANVDTVGFKQDLTAIRERLVESVEDLRNPSWSDPILDRMTGGLLASPTRTDFTQGMLSETGNRLDVAIDGDGFLTVQDGDEVRYTRDGRLVVSRAGELVTAAGGHQVLSTNGIPIVIPHGLENAVRIEASGMVRAGDRTLGQISVVGFEDQDALVKTGGNLFRAVTGEPLAVEANLRIGFTEASTVHPTREMVNMIQVARAYEMNATLAGLADSTLGRAVNDIARIR